MTKNDSHLSVSVFNPTHHTRSKPAKKDGKNQDRIALITENDVLLEEVAPLLKEEFSCIEALIIDDGSVEQIEYLQPEIIIYSCNEVSVEISLFSWFKLHHYRAWDSLMGMYRLYFVERLRIL